MRVVVALICSFLLAALLSVAFTFLPNSTTSSPGGTEYAAHWVLVQFIPTGSPSDENNWTKSAYDSVGGRLSHEESGQSLRRVMFFWPKSYDELLEACEELKRQECVFDALPDPVMDFEGGGRGFKYIHERDAMFAAQRAQENANAAGQANQSNAAQLPPT